MQPAVNQTEGVHISRCCVFCRGAQNLKLCHNPTPSQQECSDYWIGNSGVLLLLKNVCANVYRCSSIVGSVGQSLVTWMIYSWTDCDATWRRGSFPPRSLSGRWGHSPTHKKEFFFSNWHFRFNCCCTFLSQFRHCHANVICNVVDDTVSPDVIHISLNVFDIICGRWYTSCKYKLQNRPDPFLDRIAKRTPKLGCSFIRFSSMYICSVW